MSIFADPPFDDRIHVTVPGHPGDPRAPLPDLPGIVVHHVPPLHPDDVDVVRGIPCTSVARTLIDCAEDMDRIELQQLWAVAFGRGQVTLDEVRAARARVEWRPSLRLVDRLVEGYSDRRTMASVPVEIAPGATLQPLTREQYERMVDHGILGEDDRLELLDGLLVTVTPQGELHGGTVQWLTDWAYDGIERQRFAIRVQLPLRCLPASAPEPDLALVHGAHYMDQHPTGAALAVEIAVSSSPIDLGVKRSVYARGGVEEYWVLRPSTDTIRVHRTPRDGDYTRVEDVAEATFEGAVLRMADRPRT